MKTNPLYKFIFLCFFMANCTVKKANKIALICDGSTIKNQSIKELMDMKVGIIEVFYVSNKDTVINIENSYNNYFFFNPLSIPLEVSSIPPTIGFSDGAYNLTFKKNTYDTDIIIWALPIDSLKQKNLKNIDLKRWVNSMKYFEMNKSQSDSLNYLENIYYLGKYNSNNKYFENTWDVITTHLIAKHSKNNSK